jgi:hypothetical protein
MADFLPLLMDRTHGYDVISANPWGRLCGPFSIFRNTELTRMAYLSTRNFQSTEGKKQMIADFQHLILTPENQHFNEFGFTPIIRRMVGRKR